MKIGFFAGSFDPFTIGHLNILKTATKLFDKVIVGIGINPQKTRRFERKIMKDAIMDLLLSEKIKNVKVITYDGLPAEAALEYEANFLIRGIRNGDEYKFEENLAILNKEISNIDTLFLRSDKYSFISSSMAYELFIRNVDVSKYIPQIIIDAIKKWDISLFLKI